MELLAPAGSMAALRSAVIAGADAVYLGGKVFSARQSAANFDLEELQQAVEYCHLYGVRVYVTVNILTHERELKQAGNFLCQLASLNVDALIVQDLGVAKLARIVAPQIELHASTQMTIHNSKSLHLLAELGFSRVVLAREMLIGEIKHIHTQYPLLGLEVFAHGALCYGYSGQCLLSSMIGSRSGNRGACAQPCRLPYSLYRDGTELQTDGSYLLSPRDLCLIDYLQELKDAGAEAIKIEGRLKRPEYVYTVVNTYRKALNQGRSYRLSDEDEIELKQAFNRGFTKGFAFEEKGRALMSYSRPDNRGVDIGSVVRTGKDGALVSLSGDVEKGDVFTYRLNNQVITKTCAQSKKSGEKILIKGQDLPPKGQQLARVLSGRQQKNVESALKKVLPRFDLDIRVRIREDEKMQVFGKDDTGLCSVVESDVVAERAEKRPLTKERICQQFGKLGNTPYRLASCEVDFEGMPILPISNLNECRRRLVDDLNRLRYQMFDKAVNEKDCAVKYKELLSRSLETRETHTPTQLAVAVASPEEASAAIKAGADFIYYGRREATMPTIEELERVIKRWPNKLAWRLPRITKDAEIKEIVKRLEKAVAAGLTQVLVDNLGQLVLLKDMSLKTISGSGIPVFNRLSSETLLSVGVNYQTMSLELNASEIEMLLQHTSCNFETVVHGKLLLMINENCLLQAACYRHQEDCEHGDYALVDRKGMCFPVTTDKKHRSYVYNCQDLCLLSQVPFLISRGIARLRIEATGRGETYVTDVTSKYRQAIDDYYGGCWNKELFFELERQLLRYSEQGFTKGHFKRGVK